MKSIGGGIQSQSSQGSFNPPIPLSDVTNAASATVVTNIINGNTPVGKASLADALTNGIAISDVTNLQDNLDTLSTNTDNVQGSVDTVAGTIANILSGVQSAGTAQIAVMDSLGNTINGFYLPANGSQAMSGSLDMANSDVVNANGIYCLTIYTAGSNTVFDLSANDGSWSSIGGNISASLDGRFTAASFGTVNGNVNITELSGALGMAIFWDTDGSGHLANGTIVWDADGNLIIGNLTASAIFADLLIQIVTNHSTSFTLEGNSLHTINSATPTTATLPAISSTRDGFMVELKNIGVGTCTITAAGSDHIFFNVGGLGTKTCATGESFRIVLNKTATVWEIR